MTRWAAVAWRALPPVALAACLFASAPRWPDDWDGIGFLQSVEHFDLDRFAPHPPGYPVYVALLKIAACLVGDPMRAATLVAALSGAVTFVGARAALPHGSHAGRNAVALACVANPLAWRAFTAVGGEAPALALTALSCWALSRLRRRRDLVVAASAGVGIGLALGVRLSWAPLLVALVLVAPRSSRAVVVGGAIAATVSWLAPLLVVVEPAHLWSISSTHFAGHAQRWGGTAITEPQWGERASLLLRDVFVDGLGVDSDVLGLVVGALLVVSLLALLRRRTTWRGRWLLTLVPYSVWIFVGQNLRTQPRHALPLVAGLVLWFGLASLRAGIARVALPLALTMMLRTSIDSHDRATIPPVGEQLVAWMKQRPNAVLFGGASTRFFANGDLRSQAFLAGSVGDVEVAMAKMDSLPPNVYVTGEIEGHASTPLVRLCRPPRIDRAGCLPIYALSLP